MQDHPVRLLVTDDLERNRLTVFFRLLLAIPHLIWVAVWGLAAVVAVIISWFATLIAGTSPASLHAFLARYLKYATQVHAYVFLVASPYPSFEGRDGYPIDLEIAPPQPQNRWKVGFRVILAIPAFLLDGALGGHPGVGVGRGGSNSGGGVLLAAGILAWFVGLIRGKSSRGLRDASAYGIGYGAQLWAYLLLLTDRYPDSDPLRMLSDLPARSDPVDVHAGGELRRSRLTVFFRLLLALPHVIWLMLWGLVTLIAAIISWFATLIAGRTPTGLHGFIARYVRYQLHVTAFLYIVANPFPGFTGAPDSYPVEASIAEPRAQNRWKVAFRIVLVIPALMVAGAYGAVLTVVALFGWFVGLILARMPLGLRNAGALALRYHTQTSGYLLLLTDAYPYSGPVRPLEQTVPAAPIPPAPSPAIG